LVVDDREDVAMGLAILLKHLGHTVQIAYHAEGALQLGERLHPDVIFLDIGLPDRSGYEVCKEIREAHWGTRTFIVAVTGRNDPADLLRAANTGFDRHVGKPMSMDTLAEIMRTVEFKMGLSGSA
jgi:CheY-like chemotaxis protein